MKRFSIETAGNTRTCHDCGEPIFKGEKCLTFRKGGGQFQVIGNLCSSCMLEMLLTIFKFETKTHHEKETTNGEKDQQRKNQVL
jgi:RNase P subunit RPR2